MNFRAGVKGIFGVSLYLCIALGWVHKNFVAVLILSAHCLKTVLMERKPKKGSESESSGRYVLVLLHYLAKSKENGSDYMGDCNLG